MLTRTIARFGLTKRLFGTMKVPPLGDSISEGTLVEWNVERGAYVKEDDVVCVIETDKVTVDVRATESGLITELHADPDDSILIDQDLVTIDPSAEMPTEVAPVVDDAPTPINVTSADIAASVDSAAAAAAEAVAIADKATVINTPQQSTQQPTHTREHKTVKMTRMRQRIAERMKDAQNTCAMLTTFNEIDMTNIMNLRNLRQEEFQRHNGIKLGYMGMFGKACSNALEESPIINAVIDGDSILYRDYVDISVAVASPKGLVVPVIRNCNELTTTEIEREINQKAQLARDDQLTLEDMAGGTFTISNGGVFGSLVGTPIINPPQSAIMGMHGIKQRPTVRDGEVVAAPMMWIALTYDHRLIDGRDAAHFLKSIVHSVENPETLLE